MSHVSSTLDELSMQLHDELRAAVRASLSTRRPVLHHLNADTSWLLQLPRPESAIRKGGRVYYNILIDPWFRGTQTDYFAWFSRQWHATPSAVGSIAQLEEMCRDMEDVAQGLQADERKGKAGEDTVKTFIDVLVISHEFTDHCHRETLMEVHPNVPVLANKEAIKTLESWQHFRSVTPIDVFGAHGDADWRGTSTPPLPAWVGISRLLQKKDIGALHSAILITFNNKHGTGPPLTRGAKAPVRHAPFTPSEDEEAAEAIIYTPHGIASTDLTLIPQASPPIRTLALLHGLHSVRVGAALQINLGAENGLKVQRLLNARYWIGTHDEVKEGVGLVGWLMKRSDVSYKDAQAQGWQAKQKEKGQKEAEISEFLGDLDGTNWVELKNGESKVLQ